VKWIGYLWVFHLNDLKEGLDLAAINIQRGRDHGIPSYLKWREACGLLKRPLSRKGNQTVASWEDFSEATEIPKEKVEWFSSVYEDPWDVDLFPGGMVEYPVKGAILGPTFSCIIGQTFRNLRKGDRFWYENPEEFTAAQLGHIRNTTLARVICDTSDGIRTMQPIIFLLPDDKRNPRTNCSDTDVIPSIDYSAWKEQPLPIPLSSNVISREDLFDRDLLHRQEEYYDDDTNTPMSYSLLDTLGISLDGDYSAFSTLPFNGDMEEYQMPFSQS